MYDTSSEDKFKDVVTFFSEKKQIEANDQYQHGSFIVQQQNDDLNNNSVDVIEHQYTDYMIAKKKRAQNKNAKIRKSLSTVTPLGSNQQLQSDIGLKSILKVDQAKHHNIYEKQNTELKRRAQMMSNLLANMNEDKQTINDDLLMRNDRVMGTNSVVSHQASPLVDHFLNPKKNNLYPKQKLPPRKNKYANVMPKVSTINSTSLSRRSKSKSKKSISPNQSSPHSRLNRLSENRSSLQPTSLKNNPLERYSIASAY